MWRRLPSLRKTGRLGSLPHIEVVICTYKFSETV